MAETEAHGGQLKCVVVTPEETVLDVDAEFVVLPLFDGELGVAPKHSPMIGRLGFGELRITQSGNVRRFYVDGGFVQVVDDVVSVLTGRSVEASRLNAETAQEQLAAAQNRPSNSPELMAIRDRAVDQARAQLRIAERSR